MNKTAIVFGAIAAAASASGALAGSGQPFDNLQPSLAVTELMLSHGVFPSRDESGSALGDTLGFVYDFAGSALPGTTLAANGQLLPVAPTALFSLLGTTYGGNGRTTYALPDLQGRAIIGAGAGPGLTPRTLGAAVGSPTASLTSAQVPAPGASSASAPYNTMQPSLHAADADRDQWRFPGAGRRRRNVRLRRPDRKFRRDLRSERLGGRERPASVDRGQRVAV